jgi:SAM-dependent methyltransferase
VTDDAPGAAVRRHYAAPHLLEEILAALREAGIDETPLDPDRLAPADQFHSRGLAATEALASLAGFAPGAAVLDLGAGIGGPARWIAKRHPVSVTGLDLSLDYCRVAARLTARCGLEDRVRFVEGDALAMPFADASFDLVWTQHVASNIANRPQLYAEVARVLKPGGRFVLHDIFAGPVEGLHFPVPWATAPAMSHLLRPNRMKTLLGTHGFEAAAWLDMTAPTLAWLDGLAGRQAAPVGLGPWLVMGADYRTKLANLRRNLAEGRIEIHMGAFRRTA